MMCMTARRRGCRDRGAAAVEFALIVPIVFLLLVGIITFGFVLNAQVTITQAAREGARLAAICYQDPSCSSTVVARTQGAAPGLTIPAGGVSVDTSGCGTTGASGTPGDAIVTVTYTVNLGIPPVAGGVTLHGTAHMPCGG